MSAASPGVRCRLRPASPTSVLTATTTDGRLPVMLRSKRKKQAPEPAAQTQVEQAPVRSGGYDTYELTTFDGKGNPTVVVYTRDASGRTVKTLRKGRRADK